MYQNVASVVPSWLYYKDCRVSKCSDRHLRLGGMINKDCCKFQWAAREALNVLTCPVSHLTEQHCAFQRLAHYQVCYITWKGKNICPSNASQKQRRSVARRFCAFVLCTHTHAPAHTRTRSYTHARTHARIHTHTHARTHTHTHTHTQGTDSLSISASCMRSTSIRTDSTLQSCERSVILSPVTS